MIMLRMTVLTLCVLGSAFCANILREGSPEPRPKAIASETGSTTPKKGNSLRDLSVNDPTKTPERKPFKKGVGPSPLKANVTPGGSGTSVATKRREADDMGKPYSLLEFSATCEEEEFKVFGSHILMHESVLKAIRAENIFYQESFSAFCVNPLKTGKELKKHQLEPIEKNFWGSRLVNCLERVILEMPYRIESRVLRERTNGSHEEPISGANKARVLAHAFPYELILKMVTSSMTKVFFIPLQQACDKNGVPMANKDGSAKLEGPYIEFHYDVTLTADQRPDSPLRCKLSNLGDCKAVIAFNESRNEHGAVVNPDVFDTLFHACFHTTDQQRLTRIPVRVEAGLAPRLAFKIQRQLVSMFPVFGEE